MSMFIDQHELLNEIKSLIDTKREGEHWDFKREHHKNNADLLHDLLCMANSLYAGRKFIIFGVDDNTKQIVGLNVENRKKQSDILDFLSQIPFSGGIRPEVALYQLRIKNKIIDVLVILDDFKKPYFLSKSYEITHEGKKERVGLGIYTRIGDKNTAKDKNADTYHIEKMWRQRFGLDLTIVERFEFLLKQPQEWNSGLIGKDKFNNDKLYFSSEDFPKYHNKHAEFQIELSEPEEREGEGFCYFYADKSSYWGTASFKYHSTTLFEIPYVICDGLGGILLPEPEIENLFPKKFGNYFYYYILDSRTGLFFRFLRQSLNLRSNRGKASILVFENQEELSSFILYAKEKESFIENIIIENSLSSKTKNIIERRSENFNFLQRIEKIYDIWKDEQNKLKISS